MKIQRVFRENLARALADQETTPYRLARDSGVTGQMIGYILKQQRSAGLQAIEAISDALGTAAPLMLLPNLDTTKNQELTLKVFEKILLLDDECLKAVEEFVNYQSDKSAKKT